MVLFIYFNFKNNNFNKNNNFKNNIFFKITSTLLEIFNYNLRGFRLSKKKSFKVIDRRTFCEVAHHNKLSLTSGLVIHRNPNSFVPNYYALILAISVHVRITIIADSEYVRWQLPDFTVLIEFDLFRGINRQYLIWIDGDQNGACVCLQNYYVILYRQRICAPAFCSIDRP